MFEINFIKLLHIYIVGVIFNNNNRKKIWKIKPKYVSPRDTATWLKLLHRTLWVAKNGGGDPTCSAQGCHHEGSQQHLMECQVIKTQFWDKVVEYMEALDLEAENTPHFWMGVQANKKPVTSEQATVIVIAWRALYAADVHARLNDKNMNLRNAFRQMTRLVLSRVKAHGAKWRRWYINQRLWQVQKRKVFPLEHRRNKLITFDATARYEMRKELVEKMKEAHSETD